MPNTNDNTISSHAEISIAGFNALLDAAVDGIIIIDGQGLIRNMNRAAQALFGYSSEEVQNQNVKMLMPEPYKNEHDEYLKNYQDGGEAKIIGVGRQVQAVRKDAGIFPINLSVGEYREDGERYFIGIIHDLTEQLAAERMTQEFRNRLAHVDRVSTMGEMASGIAHELNQPLAAIGSYVQACQRRIDQRDPDMGKIREILEKVEQQALRASSVIDRVRSLVRPHDVVRNKVNINDLMIGAVELAKVDAISRGIDLQTEFSDQAVEVDVDTVQVQQVVLNLIRNAIDATEEVEPRPGRILISTSCSADSASVTVRIRDWGAGVSPHIRERLFHPFVSSKSTGTGLGLSISRSIIEAHGGQLWVEDADQGSEFHFTIPACNSDDA